MTTKVITCADCKYHQCRSECGHVNGCSGYCVKHKHIKRCYSPRCKDFEKDEVFITISKMVQGIGD